MSKIFPFKEFMNHLKELQKEPPYRIFIFISPILLIITLLLQKDYIGFFIIVLIYSMGGIVWRHAIKDVRGRIEDKYGKSSEEFKNINLWLTDTYQLINVILFIVLVIALVLLGLGTFCDIK